MSILLRSRGTSIDNSRHAKQIQDITEQHITELFDDFARTHIARINSGRSPIARVNPALARVATMDEMITMALGRSFDIQFGYMIEQLARDIASLSYEVTDHVPTVALTPEQRQQVMRTIDDLDHHWPTDVKEIEQGYDSADKRSPLDMRKISEKLFLGGDRVLDAKIDDKHADIHYLLELKSSGALSKSSARSARLELMIDTLGYHNYLRQQDKVMLDHKITPFLGIAQPGQTSAVTRQYFDKDSIVESAQLWPFLTQLDDGQRLVFDRISLISKTHGKERWQEVIMAAEPITPFEQAPERELIQLEPPAIDYSGPEYDLSPSLRCER